MKSLIGSPSYDESLLQERKIEVMLNVGHRHGICLVANIKNNRVSSLTETLSPPLSYALMSLLVVVMSLLSVT